MIGKVRKKLPPGEWDYNTRDPNALGTVIENPSDQEKSCLAN